MAWRVASKLMDLDLELLHATEALRFIDAACGTSSAKRGDCDPSR